MSRCSRNDFPNKNVSPSELLRVVELLDLDSIKRGVQSHDGACYDVLLPEQITEKWVTDHIQEVFLDDQASLALLQNSMASDDPATRLARMRVYKLPDNVFYIWHSMLC